ncbi:hypothetical protein BU16DRAFT_525186, partial [Lophium mytilinum]
MCYRIVCSFEDCPHTFKQRVVCPNQVRQEECPRFERESRIHTHPGRCLNDSRRTISSAQLPSRSKKRTPEEQEERRLKREIEDKAKAKAKAKAEAKAQQDEEKEAKCEERRSMMENS